MLVLQLLLAVQSMLITNIRLFALQSLLLAAIAGVVGYAYGAWHVLVVAVLTILGKVILPAVAAGTAWCARSKSSRKSAPSSTCPPPCSSAAR